MYEWDAYYETRHGDGVLYKTLGFLECNDDGKVLTKVTCSNETIPSAKAVVKALGAIETA